MISFGHILSTDFFAFYVYMYVTCIAGILTNGADDFEDSEEVYEAIGALLHEVSQEKTEDDVKEICERLMGNENIFFHYVFLTLKW